MKKARLIALSALISGALLLTGCQNQPTKEEQQVLLALSLAAYLAAKWATVTVKKLPSSQVPS